MASWQQDEDGLGQPPLVYLGEELPLLPQPVCAVRPRMPALAPAPITDGPAAHKGLTAFCIYHVDGDVLRWCPSVPGAGYRLTQYPNVFDDRFRCRGAWRSPGITGPFR